MDVLVFAIKVLAVLVVLVMMIFRGGDEGGGGGGGGVTCHFPSVPPYQLESLALYDR